MTFDGGEIAFTVDVVEVEFVSGFGSEGKTATTSSLSCVLGFDTTFDELDFASPFVDGFEVRPCAAISGFAVSISVFVDSSDDEI